MENFQLSGNEKTAPENINEAFEKLQEGFAWEDVVGAISSGVRILTNLDEKQNEEGAEQHRKAIESFIVTSMRFLRSGILHELGLGKYAVAGLKTDFLKEQIEKNIPENPESEEFQAVKDKIAQFNELCRGIYGIANRFNDTAEGAQASAAMETANMMETSEQNTGDGMITELLDNLRKMSELVKVEDKWGRPVEDINKIFDEHIKDFLSRYRGHNVQMIGALALGVAEGDYRNFDSVDSSHLTIAGKEFFEGENDRALNMIAGEFAEIAEEILLRAGYGVAEEFISAMARGADEAAIKMLKKYNINILSLFLESCYPASKVDAGKFFELFGEIAEGSQIKAGTFEHAYLPEGNSYVADKVFRRIFSETFLNYRSKIDNVRRFWGALKLASEKAAQESVTISYDKRLQLFNKYLSGGLDSDTFNEYFELFASETGDNMPTHLKIQFFNRVIDLGAPDIGNVRLVLEKFNKIFENKGKNEGQNDERNKIREDLVNMIMEHQIFAEMIKRGDEGDIAENIGKLLNLPGMENVYEEMTGGNEEMAQKKEAIKSLLYNFTLFDDVPWLDKEKIYNDFIELRDGGSSGKKAREFLYLYQVLGPGRIRSAIDAMKSFTELLGRRSGETGMLGVVVVAPAIRNLENLFQDDLKDSKLQNFLAEPKFDEIKTAVESLASIDTGSFQHIALREAMVNIERDSVAEGPEEVHKSAEDLYANAENLASDIEGLPEDVRQKFDELKEALNDGKMLDMRLTNDGAQFNLSHASVGLFNEYINLCSRVSEELEGKLSELENKQKSFFGALRVSKQNIEKLREDIDKVKALESGLQELREEARKTADKLNEFIKRALYPQIRNLEHADPPTVISKLSQEFSVVGKFNEVVFECVSDNRETAPLRSLSLWLKRVSDGEANVGDYGIKTEDYNKFGRAIRTLWDEDLKD